MPHNKGLEDRVKLLKTDLFVPIFFVGVPTGEQTPAGDHQRVSLEVYPMKPEQFTTCDWQSRNGNRRSI